MYKHLGVEEDQHNDKWENVVKHKPVFVYEFPDYFETVTDNISESILNTETWYSHFHAIQEFIHELYFLKVSVAKATRIVESLFVNFGNRLKEGSDHKEADKYLSND